MYVECKIRGDYINDYTPISLRDAVSDNLIGSNFWYAWDCEEKKRGIKLRDKIADYESYEEDGFVIVNFYMEEGINELTKEEEEFVDDMISEELISWNDHELIDMFGKYLCEDIDEEHNCAWVIPEVYLEEINYIPEN